MTDKSHHQETHPRRNQIPSADKGEPIVVATSGALVGAGLGFGVPGAIIGGIIGFLICVIGENARQKRDL